MPLLEQLTDGGTHAYHRSPWFRSASSFQRLHTARHRKRSGTTTPLGSSFVAMWSRTRERASSIFQLQRVPSSRETKTPSALAARLVELDNIIVDLSARAASRMDERASLFSLPRPPPPGRRLEEKVLRPPPLVVLGPARPSPSPGALVSLVRLQGQAPTPLTRAQRLSPNFNGALILLT